MDDQESIDQDLLFEDLVTDTNTELDIDQDPDLDPNTETDADLTPDQELTTDPDLDPAIDPEINNTPNTDADTDTDTDDASGTGDDNLTGIERYLSQFDIEAGMIQFEDGTSTHFNELEADRQSEILSQLHTQQASTIEDKFGLDEGEISLINYIRENNTTVEGMVEELANERVQTLLAMQQTSSDDFDSMADDSVYTKFLQNSSPDATPEQLEEDLEKAKQQTNYKNVVESVRTQFKTEQQSELARAQQDEKLNQQATLEEQRQQVIDTVIGIGEVDGIELNDGTKNGILDHVLEVNEHGDSLFMEEVFGEPDKLFKAAFWFYNGAEILKQRDDYWKKEKSAAFKRGKESALGKDSTKLSFIKRDETGAQSTSTPSQSNNNYLDLDELHLGT